MRTSLFDYTLPPAAIAQRPPALRDGARMLTLAGEGNTLGQVRELAELMPSDSLCVLNRTQVLKARLIGARKGSGGKVELLLLHQLEPHVWTALGKANRPVAPGQRVLVKELEVEILAKDEAGTLTVRLCSALPDFEIIERVGAMPIPPYVQREADAQDVERYQTVFAREPGSVAAPTAGLHLTQAGLARLRQRGVRFAELLLHVGVGTFRPVISDDLDQHVMHSEWVNVPSETVQAVREARAEGRRVVAIGTTVVRALESAADLNEPGTVRPFCAATDLLIQPGYQFRVVDALLTNFHMPRSTLLALVAAFAGRRRVLDAYTQALGEGFRFLSYGDAMWIPERLSDSAEARADV